MKTPTEGLHAGPRIPAWHRCLAALQLGLAGLSLLRAIFGGCGSCDLEAGLHAAIAGAGVAGYAGLLLLGLRNARTPFYLGVFAAAGVHSALAIVLLQTRNLCLPCGASALLSFVLTGAALSSDRTPLGLAPWSFALALALSLGVLFPTVARSARADSPVGPAIATIRPPDGRERFRLDVFESGHCSYCLEFREHYLPRLHLEFGSELEVAFHDAGETGWVRRTPTIVVRGGPVFEGLPARVEDLGEALRASTGKRMARKGGR